MAAAQTPQGGGAAAAPVQAPAPRSGFPKLAPGCVFSPNGPCLFNRHLIPMALRGVLDEPYRGFVAVGVDVYAVRPETLPFPRSNRGMHDKVWDYYFTTRPPAAAGGSGSGVAEGGSSRSEDDDDDDGVREVAAGGCWRRYGGEKEYVGDDGEAYGFRRRFAFHEAEAEAGARGKKTVWRMKEFRLNETAPRFSGVVFRPGGEGLVICKVYNEVIPEEEPAVDYYNINDDDDDEEEEVIGAVVITVRDAAAAPNP